jgi:hypothetical protein
VVVGCNARCTLRLDVVVDRATQRRYRLPSRTIGRRTFVVPTAGRRPARITLTRVAKQRLAHARSARVSVQASWVGARPALRRTGLVRLRR